MNDTPAYAEHTSYHAADGPTCGNDDPAVTHSTPAAEREPQVYLIANPVSRSSTAWPGIIETLNGRVKNAALVEFSGLFADTADYKARWPEAVRQLAGAVVVPLSLNGGLMLGVIALREAEQIAAVGKPVLIYTREGLFPWAQAEVKIHARKGKKDRFTVELIIARGAR
jgi:hypothetical protein